MCDHLDEDKYQDKVRIKKFQKKICQTKTSVISHEWKINSITVWKSDTTTEHMESFLWIYLTLQNCIAQRFHKAMLKVYKYYEAKIVEITYNWARNHSYLQN